jgi:hypothetical protein
MQRKLPVRFGGGWAETDGSTPHGAALPPYATALLDPAAYGLDRPPAPLPAVQALLGHADIATTAGYTRASAADLARMLGEPSDVYITLEGA